MRGEMQLDEDVIRYLFGRENVHGIRDLWEGHRLLETAHRLEKIPKDMHHYRLMRNFYHAIVGKLRNTQEIDVTECILLLAKDQGILSEADVYSILGDIHILVEISEGIIPVVFNLCYQGQGLEEVRSALHQLRESNLRKST